MGLNVRLAEKKDYNEVSYIATQAHNFHVIIRPDLCKNLKNSMNQTFFDKLVENNEIYVLENENIEGYAILLFKEIENEITSNRKYCFIESIGIREEKRRQGLGTFFFNEIKKIAKEEKCKAIELGVYSKNKCAISFYNKMNMLDKQIIKEYIL